MARLLINAVVAIAAIQYAACDADETKDYCPADCPSDYCPKTEPKSESCPTPNPCPKPQCKCRINNRRAENGKCIPTRDCPGKGDQTTSTSTTSNPVTDCSKE
ncbi:hypothetical protein MSG28_007295 [Choristoneura fumiferana]|uniref:Uncharacterized protein n=1 Tax=Choristoneura fumiferana TaxID=7141 RepID=A0ACC0JWD2_CHOFU|nr:hypothetical protein MSG28_007295 [Choristoneura fumiferana]